MIETYTGRAVPSNEPGGDRKTTGLHCGTAATRLPMSDTFARQETMLAEALATTIRGPRRNGLFAAWLVLRCCGDALATNRVSERGHRRRVDALEHRLHGLSLPPPLRRALTGALHQLREQSPRKTSIALQQLVAPVRETLGAGPGDAMARAANVAQHRVRNARIG